MSGRTLLVASNRNPGLCEQTQKKKELVHITEPFQGRFLTLSISLFSSVAIHPHEVSPAQDGGGGGNGGQWPQICSAKVLELSLIGLSWVTWLPVSQALCPGDVPADHTWVT